MFVLLMRKIYMKRKLLYTLMCGVVSIAASLPAVAQEQDDDVRPSPPSIGADVPVTYFGPPPSTVEPELIGPVQLLRSGTVDEDAGTIELPLYRGQLKETGENVWYIITDTTDIEAATALGLNLSQKLAFAENDRAVRIAETNTSGTLLFHWGAVDFSPVRNVTPNALPNAFPPLSSQPGSVGDELYSPLVKILNAGGHIYNAPMIAFNQDEDDFEAYCDGIDESEEAEARTMLHDGVVSICADDNGGTVTMELAAGFSFAKPVLYLSTDTNNPLAAALEKATFAPGLRDVRVGADDSLFSSVERIFGFTNGPVNSFTPEGAANPEINPQRQGFESALRGEGGPLNVLGGIPTVATDYSPLWDLNLGEWTQEAIDNNYRTRLTEEFQILGYVERGFITGPGGSLYGSSGIIINCPIVQRFL